MNVLIADKFQAWGIDELKLAGCTVACEPNLHGDALRDAVRRTGCHVLIVRSTKVPAQAMEDCPDLGLIIRAGAGYNTIDVEAASRNSIFVANCPGKNAVAVAELTFALILALDRRIVENTLALRDGRWNKKEFSNADGLKDRTLGVIGLGEIGRAVARRAQAFEMKVAAWSRSLTSEGAAEMHVRKCDSPAEVAAHSHVVTIHLAANADTKHIINADVLERMQPGSCLINTARAEVLDYAALARVVRDRRIRVGLDVFPDEPAGGEADYRAAILEAGGVIYGTHHVGASTSQAQNAIAAEAVRIVKVFMKRGVVENCVNVAADTPAKSVLLVRHRNRPGVLAHVLNAISVAGVNVSEMENTLCAGLESACAKIHLDDALSDAVLATIRDGHEHVLAVSQMKAK
ncbi:MAG: hydroxyacid dehydrogenase [Phycisphaerales bacterium]|nr:MAG: hydroxyacid dehydrogenase [Phycisphaerales bacterium]